MPNYLVPSQIVLSQYIKRKFLLDTKPSNFYKCNKEAGGYNLEESLLIDRCVTHAYRYTLGKLMKQAM